MRANTIIVSELAKRLGCRFEGRSDLILTGMATIRDAEADQLTFLSNPRYRKELSATRAGAIIVAADEKTPPGITRIISDKPYIDFQRALEILYRTEAPDRETGIDQRAAVHESAQIGENVRISPFVEIAAGAKIGDGCSIACGACIGRDVTIGGECVIGYGAVIRREVEIGDRVVIGDGTIIGFDGFGYAPDESGYHKIPQVGKVIIEDDVEIGANCCVDRATIGATLIGRGSKLDNLIQIAHGVQIGRNTVIAAQTGISGSTRIGSKVMMGGQVGIVGHVDIGDGMIIGAQAGVTKSCDIKGMISGYPARPHLEALKRDAGIGQIPGLMRRLKELEGELEALKRSMDAAVKRSDPSKA